MKKRIIIMAIAAVFAAGCSQRSGAGLSPAETVEHFCTALASGDFAKAASLCGSGSADSCIGAYRTAWEKSEKNDSSAMKIAAGILSGMEVQVTDVRKEGDALPYASRRPLQPLQKSSALIKYAQELMPEAVLSL